MKLALSNAYSSTLIKGGISHTHNGPNHRIDRMRIDYTLTRQAHRPRVHDVKVHPQPPPRAKANSDHNLVCASVVVSGPTAKCEMPQEAASSTHSFHVQRKVTSASSRESRFRTCTSRTDHDLDHLDANLPLRCAVRICIVQIHYKEHVVDDSDYAASTRQHELDHTWYRT